jgi:hypothetical protein
MSGGVIPPEALLRDRHRGVRDTDPNNGLCQGLRDFAIFMSCDGLGAPLWIGSSTVRGEPVLRLRFGPPFKSKQNSKGWVRAQNKVAQPCVAPN